MKKIDFISYLETLTENDWSKKVTSQWSVKDVVAHLTGWEKDDVDAIRSIWTTKELPWWMKTKNYDDYNKKWVDYYSSYTSGQLLNELKICQQAVADEINRIGEANLREYPELFSWLFDETDKSHYSIHLRQIKEAVSGARGASI
ncbi:MAG: hypothetical protein QY321_01585 [Patescibacteria group bacterium]|nr:MAG: hypothetical protein QY321_01585 [Patescibacteria group bacterium]